MRIRKLKLVKAFSLAATMLGIGLGGACSKKKSADEASDSDVAIAGSLALSDSTESSLRLAPALEDVQFYCVSFEIPPVAGTGAVSAEGAFELTLATKDASVGCFILADEEVLGTVVFEDDTQKDMSGNNKQSDRFAFAGGKTNLGSFTLDLATGKAVVKVSQIVREKAADTSGAAANALDFTGNYIIKDSGIVPLPTGYVGPCTPEDGKDHCEGPPLDFPLWVKRVDGVDTTSGANKFGMMLWYSEDDFTACGSKLGFSYEDAKTNAGIDLTNSGIGEGDFTWDASLEDGWKDTANARANHSLMKMENVEDFNGYPGTKQYFKQYRTHTCNENGCSEGTPVEASGFQFFANTKDTGCRNSANEPIQMTNWDNMKCENEDLTGGLHKNTCSKEVDGDTVTCVHIGGTYDAKGNTLGNAMTRFPDDYEVYAQGAYCDTNGNNQRDAADGWPRWNGESQSCESGALKDGDLCKDIDVVDAPSEMAQLRCYMEASHQGGKKDQSDGLCRRRIEGNWSATSPEDFLGNGPTRPEAQIFFELFDYTSPTSGTMRTEERRFEGVQVGNNWTDCEVITVGSLALSKYPDSDDLLAEMVETSRNVSSKPACVAEYGEGKIRKMLFKFEKQ